MLLFLALLLRTVVSFRFSPATMCNSARRKRETMCFRFSTGGANPLLFLAIGSTLLCPLLVIASAEGRGIAADHAIPLPSADAILEVGHRPIPPDGGDRGLHPVVDARELLHPVVVDHDDDPTAHRVVGVEDHDPHDDPTHRGRDLMLRSKDQYSHHQYFVQYGKLYNQQNMLQDSVRTGVYKRAIMANVAPGSTVYSLKSCRVG